MTKYKQGDIIIVNFGFSEGVGSKKRPALIISNDKYHKNRQEVIIMPITHNVKRILFGDTKINDWEKAGLLYPSLIAGIARTIKDSLILHKLGSISQQDFLTVQENFKKTIHSD